MNCEICTGLAGDYERTKRLFTEASNRLQERSAKAAIDEYSSLRLAENEARLEFNIAKLHLERHQDLHRKAN